MKLKIIKNSTKMINLGFIFVFFLFSIFYFIVYMNIKQIRAKLNEITNSAFPIVETGDDLIITLQKADKLARELLLAIDLKRIDIIEKNFDKIAIQNRVAKEKIIILSNKNPVLKKSLILVEKEIIEFFKYAKLFFSDHRTKVINNEPHNFTKDMKVLDQKVNITITEIGKIIKLADSILLNADKNTKSAISTTIHIMLFVFVLLTLTGFFISSKVTSTIAFSEEVKSNAYAEIDQIWNSASVGMWLIDKYHIVIRVNNTLLNMLKLKRENIIGKNFNNIWEKMGCETGLGAFKKAISENREIEYEKIINKKDEKSIVCFVKTLPFLSNKGEITGILESFTDITERKSIEKDIMNAIESERQRIGQDIHDSLGQKLTGLSYLTQVIRMSLKEYSQNKAVDTDDTGKVEEIEEIDDCIKIIHELIDHTRKLSKGLHPENLDRFGLVPAIKELVLDTEKIFNTVFQLDIDEDILINDNDIKINLYYIARESINNSIKHGKSKNINLSLKKNGQQLILNIVDDGKEQVVKKDFDKGIGLRIMEYRAGLINADFNARKMKSGYNVSVKVVV